MAFDKDCPCNTDCPDRPNCKGCERGNAWRKKKQEEAEQRYKEKTFHRYEMEQFQKRFYKTVENRKKNKRLTTSKKD